MINAQSCLILIATNLPKAILQDFYFIFWQVFKLNLKDHNVVKFDSVFAIDFNDPKQLIVNGLNERISFIEFSFKLRTFVAHKFQILELLSFINKLITVVMNYNFLYEHAHKKHMHNLSQQNLRIKHILTESNKPKTSLKSNQILIKKLFLELQQYDDEQIISLATSLPILHSAKMIQMLKTIQQAKMMLQQTFQNGKYLRMSYQAKFVYFLWQVLGKQQVQTLQLKRMIYLFYQKRGQELKQILIQMASKKNEAEDLYEAWKMIKDDQLYYQRSHSKKQIAIILNQTIESQNKNVSTLGAMGAISRKPTKKKSNLMTAFSTKSFDMENAANKSLNQSSQRSIHEKLYSENFYSKRQFLKNQQKQNMIKKQLEQCTFHPILQSRSKSKSKDKSIEVKGFEKTINRLVNGYNKTIQFKNSVQKYSRGQKYQQLKNKGMNPPKFLQRKKKQNKYLFAINFEINNKKTMLKIKQNETAQEAAKKLSTIYGLNKNYEQDLKELIKVQIENYYSNMQK